MITQKVIQSFRSSHYICRRRRFRRDQLRLPRPHRRGEGGPPVVKLPGGPHLRAVALHLQHGGGLSNGLVTDHDLVTNIIHLVTKIIDLVSNIMDLVTKIVDLVTKIIDPASFSVQH